MGEVIQLQGDQRKNILEFLLNPPPSSKDKKKEDKKDEKEKKEDKKKLAGLGLPKGNVKVGHYLSILSTNQVLTYSSGPWVLILSPCLVPVLPSQST